MNVTELLLIAMNAVLAAVLLFGAIVPDFPLALTRWWYELCGLNGDARVKSESRYRTVTRIGCAVGFLTMVGLTALVVHVLSEVRSLHGG